MKTIIFALVLALGLGTLAWTVSRLIRFMVVGKKYLPLDKIPERIASVVIYWLMQKKVPEKTMDNPKPGFTSIHHLGIFWGFLIVSFGTMELWFQGLTGMDFSFLPGYAQILAVVDIFNLVV